MKVIHLDASEWRAADDFYLALLPQLGAPEWHGRNLDALNDSFYGGINKVAPPFRVSIEGATHLRPQLKDFLAQVAEVFADARQRGEDIDIQIN